jgi:hypothetical protein
VAPEFQQGFGVMELKLLLCPNRHLGSNPNADISDDRSKCIFHNSSEVMVIVFLTTYMQLTKPFL